MGSLKLHADLVVNGVLVENVLSFGWGWGACYKYAGVLKLSSAFPRTLCAILDIKPYPTVRI